MAVVKHHSGRRPVCMIQTQTRPDNSTTMPIPCYTTALYLLQCISDSTEPAAASCWKQRPAGDEMSIMPLWLMDGCADWPHSASACRRVCNERRSTIRERSLQCTPPLPRHVVTVLTLTVPNPPKRNRLFSARLEVYLFKSHADFRRKWSDNLFTN